MSDDGNTMPDPATFRLHRDGIRGADTPDVRLYRAEMRVAKLEAAMRDADEVLMALSMATEGHLRGRICTASNRLRFALDRPQSYHGEQFKGGGDDAATDR